MAIDGVGVDSFTNEAYAKPAENSSLPRRIAGVVFRVLDSPLFQACCLAGAIIGFTAVVLVTPMTLPLSVSIFAIGIGVLSIVFFIATRRNEILYEASLIGCLLMNKRLLPFGRNWMDDVDEKIVLSSVPLANFGDVENAKARGVTHVLSLLEDFEFRDYMFTAPVKSEQWKNEDVKHKQIRAADFLPLSYDQITKGVEFIKNANGKVLVHCKAGVGRSATIAAAYLIDQGKAEDAHSAVKLLLKNRPQVNLNRWQLRAIDEWNAKRLGPNS